MKYYRKCEYQGRQFEVRKVRSDGFAVLIALDGEYAAADGGWERVDKFEWEKTVAVSEVTMLPDENQNETAC